MVPIRTYKYCISARLNKIINHESGIQSVIKPYYQCNKVTKHAVQIAEHGEDGHQKQKERHVGTGPTGLI